MRVGSMRNAFIDFLRSHAQQMIYIALSLYLLVFLQSTRTSTWPTSTGFSDLELVFEPGTGLEGRRVYIELEADFFGRRFLVGVIGSDLKLRLPDMIPTSVSNEIKLNVIGFDELVGVFFVRAEDSEGRAVTLLPELSEHGVVYRFPIGERPIVWKNGAPAQVVLSSSLGRVVKISTLEIPEKGLLDQIPGVSVEFTGKNFISIGGGMAIVPLDGALFAKVKVESALMTLEQSVEIPLGEDVVVTIMTSVGKSVASRLRQMATTFTDAGGTMDHSFDDALARLDSELDNMANAVRAGQSDVAYASSQAAIGQFAKAYETMRASFFYLVPWSLVIILSSTAASVSLPMLLIERKGRQLPAILMLLPVSLVGLVALHPVVRAVFSNMTLFLGLASPELAISLAQVLPFVLAFAFVASSRSARQALWESFGLASRRARRSPLRTFLLFLSIFIVATGATLLLSLSAQYKAYTFRSPMTLSHRLVGISFYEYELYQWRVTPDPHDPSLPLPHYVPLSDRTISAVMEWVQDAATYTYSVTTGRVSIRPSGPGGLGDAKTIWISIVCLDPPAPEHESAWPRSVPWESLRQGAVLVPRALDIRGWDQVLVNGRAANAIELFDSEMAVNERGPDGEDFFVGIASIQFVIVNRADFPEIKGEILRVDAIFPSYDFEGMMSELGDFVIANAVTEVGRRYDIVRTPVASAYSDGSVVMIHSGAMVTVVTGPWTQVSIPVLLAVLIVGSQVYSGLLYRKSEISTMSAMGSSPLRLFLTSMAEPLMIGIVGSMTGYYFGFMLSSLQAESFRVGLGSFVASLVVSFSSTLVGGYIGSTSGILRVVPSGRLSAEGASIVRKAGDMVLVDVPLRIDPSELSRFGQHLASLSETAPAQKYLYDGLRVVSVSLEGSRVHHIAVFYGAERSAYFHFRIEAQEGEDLEVSVTPLRDDSLSEDEWRPHHLLLLERAAHDLRGEMLRFIESDSSRQHRPS